jgi:hypothetical protein
MGGNKPGGVGALIMVVADAGGLASLLGGRWAIVDYAFFAADRRAWIRAVADVVGVALLWR